MQLRALGKTGLMVSPVGIGLAALGRPGYINLGHADDLERNYDVNAMEAHSHRVLDAAFDAGIVYFDVARSYGRSELFLNSWLASRLIALDTTVVGSKWGYAYTADWQVEAEYHEVKELSLDRLLSQWLESRSILDAHLDLYQIHSATLGSGVLTDNAVLSELARLKEAEIAIGLTVSGPEQGEVINRALDLEVDGVGLFDCVQATWNLLERSAEAQLQRAHEAGLGVIIKEGLANGRLTVRGGIEQLTDHARRLETTPDALALAAALARPWVHVVLSGAATESHLRSNLKALEVHIDDHAEIGLRELVEETPAYWRTRSRLAWN